MRERTYGEEAEIHLAKCLARIDASIYHLHRLLDIHYTDTYMNFIFVQDVFVERLRFYSDRAPISSPYIAHARDIIHRHRYRNCLIIFHSDFPRCTIWRHFENILYAMAFGSPDMLTGLPVYTFNATRGQGALSLQIGQTRKALPGFQHDCAQDQVFHKLILNQEMNWALADANFNNDIHPLTPSGSYRCDVCGWETIITVLDLRVLYEKYVEQETLLDE
jgi:hypothetical protein